MNGPALNAIMGNLQAAKPGAQLIVIMSGGTSYVLRSPRVSDGIITGNVISNIIMQNMVIAAEHVMAAWVYVEEEDE